MRKLMPRSENKRAISDAGTHKTSTAHEVCPVQHLLGCAHPCTGGPGKPVVKIDPWSKVIMGHSSCSKPCKYLFCNSPLRNGPSASIADLRSEDKLEGFLQGRLHVQGIQHIIPRPRERAAYRTNSERLGRANHRVGVVGVVVVEVSRSRTRSRSSSSR